MTQSNQGATASTTPTLAQHRAYRFVTAQIETADTSPFHAGYIHGLIQALVMVGGLTLNQACELEQMQECTSCAAHNQRALANIPRKAVGGAA